MAASSSAQLTEDVTLQLRHAQAHQQASRWSEALNIYARLLTSAKVPEVMVRRNMAGCLLAMGQAQTALDVVNRALLLNPLEPAALWIQGKALRRLRQAEQAEAVFLSLLRVFEQKPAGANTRDQVLLELSELALNEFCDPVASRSWAEQIDPLASSAHRIELSRVLTSLYHRTESAEALTQRAVSYARQNLHTPNLLPEEDLPNSGHVRAATRGKKGLGGNRKRLRIGLVSLHFSVSPVYFLTFGSFAELARRHDLVFFSRRPKADWGNAQWRGIAAEWLDVEGKSAHYLAQALRGADLDAAFDLSGWMDPEAMQAFSARPVGRQFKWVGGQAMTTGLDCFDAYLSDALQTPEALHGLYTEPLALLPHGYVRYHAPPYFPKKRPKKEPQVAGIVGNPTKVTAQVLPLLKQVAKERGITTLRFIDRHYSYSRVQSQVADCLEHSGLVLEFVVPEAGETRHQHFLNEVGRLGCVIDTSPHSAGLTALEALHLGVDVVTGGAGQLFCERHAISHCGYFGKAKSPHLAAELEQLVKG